MLLIDFVILVLESSRQIFEEPSNPTIDGGGNATTAALVNEGSENLPKIEILQLPILDEQEGLSFLNVSIINKIV